MSDDQRKRILFILSSPHSGSTILDLAIGAHSQCFSLGEIAALDEELPKDTHCVCGQRISNCAFWAAVFDELDMDIRDAVREVPSACRLKPSSNGRVSKTRFFLETSGIRRCAEPWARNTKRIYDAAFRISGRRTLIDSSKNTIRALRLASLLAPSYDCYYLHLVRDVRGVAHSCQKKTYKVLLPGEEVAREYLREDCLLPQEAARQWRHMNQRIVSLLELCVPRRRRFRVRYEDLCNSSREVLSDVSDWLGMRYEEGMPAFGETEHHNVKGNASRFNSREIRRIDESWRKSLTPDEVDLCLREAGWLRRLLGYR